MPQARTAATPNAAKIGTSRMMGVPMNAPKTSDKTVVGSSVPADKSMDDEDADDGISINDDTKAFGLLMDDISASATGSILWNDGVTLAACI